MASREETIRKLGFELVKRDCEVQDYLIQSLVNKNLEIKPELQKQVEVFKNPLSLLGSDLFNIFIKEDMMPNMIAGSTMIRRHADENKRILILTDYDCDGICSAGSIARLIKDFKGYENYSIHINKRKFGNGINPPFIESLNIDLNTVDLIVTADHGVGSIPYLNELLKQHPNLKIVITDHHIPLHKPDEEVKDRLIIIDPHLLDTDVFTKKLSGATVAALTFILALVDITDTPNHMMCWNYLTLVSDLLATSVISDVMDVSVVFNRLLVKLGLEQINSSENMMFNAFKSIVSAGVDTTIDDLRFSIVPMINSANRLHREDIAEKLFINATSREDYIKYSVDLMNCNKQRKTITNAIVSMYNDNPEKDTIGNGIVIKINTNLGINGLVSGKIGELEQKPCVCFIESEEDNSILHGSCRSIIGINLLEILETLKTEEIVMSYGGHKEACGCAIKADNYEKFKSRFKELCPVQDKKETNKVDIIINNVEVNSELYKRVKELEPYGNGFKEPVFYSEFVINSSYFNSRIMFASSDVDDLDNIEEGTGKRRLKLVAFNNGRYKVDEVFKEFAHVGCSFTFKSELYIEGRTPSLMVKHGVTITPDTELFSLI